MPMLLQTPSWYALISVCVRFPRFDLNFGFPLNPIKERGGGGGGGRKRERIKVYVFNDKDNNDKNTKDNLNP